MGSEMCIRDRKDGLAAAANGVDAGTFEGVFECDCDVLEKNACGLVAESVRLTKGVADSGWGNGGHLGHQPFEVERATSARTPEHTLSDHAGDIGCTLDLEDVGTLLRELVEPDLNLS